MKSQLIAIVAAVLVVGCGPEPSIHEAAEDGDIKRVKQHLVKGVDVNAIFKDSWTPLHMAAEGVVTYKIYLPIGQPCRDVHYLEQHF